MTVSGVAIAGMACRYGSCVTPDAYWALLMSGARLAPEAAVPDASPLDEAESALAEDLAAAAMTDAATALAGVSSGAIGLFAARARHRPDGRTGGLIAPSLAQRLGLGGLALDVDAECASSLVAVSQAWAAVGAGLCQAAVVVAVRSPSTGRELKANAELGAPAARHCTPFERDAAGWARGAGGGAIVLVRGAEPRYGAVVGAAVTQLDQGLGLAGGFERFVDTVSRICAAAAPGEALAYVEAHAVGSRIGDEMEVLALSEGLARTGPILLGSSKSQLGHLEAAAGMAGLQKLALMARENRIAPSIRVENPFTELTVPGCRLALAETVQPWPAEGSTAMAIALSQSGALAMVAVAKRYASSGQSSLDAPAKASKPPRVDARRRVGDNEAAAEILADILALSGRRALRRLRTTSFFELGLDSLKAAEAAQRLSVRCGVAVSAAQLFRAGGLSQLTNDLATMIAGREAAGRSEASRAEPETARAR